MRPKEEVLLGADIMDYLSSKGYRFFRSRKFYSPKSGHEVTEIEQHCLDLIQLLCPNTYEFVN